MSQARNDARSDSCSAVAYRSIGRSMAQPPHEVTPVSEVTVDCAAVDFDLSADQQALRDAAATLLDGKAGSDALRARVGAGAIVGTLPGAGAITGDTAADAPRGYDDAAWSAMAEQGWLAIELPDLCEEIGRRLVAAPFLPTIVALGALSGEEARADAGTKDWREALSEGAAVGCVAAAPGRNAVTVSGPRDQARLSGRTPPVAYAPSADVAVVLAGGAVYGVDLRAGGRPAPLSAMDRTRELGVLT